MDLAARVEKFLEDHAGPVLPWVRPPGAPAGLSTHFVAFGQGETPLEVAVATVENARPSVSDVRRLWKLRQAGRAAPVFLVVMYNAEQAHLVADVCGVTGDPSVATGLDVDQTERIAAAALREPDRHGAARTVDRLLTGAKDNLGTGMLNSGLFATHELTYGVPRRADWQDACARAVPALGQVGQALITALGYETQPRGSAALLLRNDDHSRAVGVLLDATETFDRPSPRFGAVSPVTHGLHIADAEGVKWLIVLRGTAIRLYSADPDVGVGRKGQAETFLELDLALLSADDAGYLTLLFAPHALAPGGTVGQILEESRNFAAELGGRLRERIYRDVVPTLAVAVGGRMEAQGDEQLAEAYHRTLMLLFRLLFVAYAEDRALLPYGRNPRYDRHALKTLARDFAADPTQRFDPEATSLWDGVAMVWKAVDEGNAGWDVPAYNGGLFSTDPQTSPSGAALAQMRLSDAEFGPALCALLVDESDDGRRGPVDFRTLSVREFGTIYEGLLESSLSIATSDLTVDASGSFVPTASHKDVQVTQGSIYFHNRSGERKSTGSYFTKHFAVEHLLNVSLEPALDKHLAVVADLLAAGDDAAAAERFFDFRVADLAMGSGHFLIAAIDRIEARFSRFLAEHPIAAVTDELLRLAASARESLGEQAAAVEIEPSSLLRRQVARRCVYGIDVNLLAVELARLAVWIHTFVPGLPMSTLSHGLQQGNSLTGIGTVSEVLDILGGTGGQSSLFEQTINDALATARERLLRVARTGEATKQEARDAAAAYASALKDSASARTLFDVATGITLGLVRQVVDADDANRVADEGTLRAELQALQATHFPILFPEVFSRDNPGFDVLIGNPPWEEATVEEMKFWALRFPGLRSLPSAEQARTIAQLRDERPDLVDEYDQEVGRAERIRRALTSGLFPGMGTGDPDLYKAFVWRFWTLCRHGGSIGVVLPRSVFATQGSAEWRQAVLPLASVEIVLTRNRDEWLFTDVNPGYSICLVGITKGVPQAAISLRGTYDNPSDFNAGITATATALPVARLQAADPLLCVPALENEAGLQLFEVLLEHPPFGAETRPDFRAVPTTELHATKDGKIYFTGNPADHPVFNHLNVGHLVFDPSIGAFNHADFERVVKDLDAKRKKLASRAGSPFALMPRAWSADPGTLPPLQPRIAIRDVVHASNPRKVWAALVPARTLLTNKAPYLLFPRGDVRVQAYVLGMLGSSVCDWYGHLRVVLNLNYFILNAIPMPVFNAGDERCTRVASLAAALAADTAGDIGDWRTLPAEQVARDRSDLLAELDALASLLYGVPDSLLPLVFDGDNPTRPPLSVVRTCRDAWQPANEAAS